MSLNSSDETCRAAALELVCDHWDHAKRLMWQIKQREQELAGAKHHFEVCLCVIVTCFGSNMQNIQGVRESVTSEVRDRLQALYNLELQQHMASLSRVQVHCNLKYCCLSRLFLSMMPCTGSIEAFQGAIEEETGRLGNISEFNSLINMRRKTMCFNQFPGFLVHKLHTDDHTNNTPPNLI